MNASLRPLLAAFTLIVFCLAFIPGCARDQELTSIQIKPSGATFGAIDPSLKIQFSASGTYVHPPQTKDITSSVTWHSDTSQVVQVTPDGEVSPSTNCGTGNVFATMHDHASGSDIASNSASVVVNGPASLGCTPSGAQAVLTVNFGGSGSGNVTSVPAGVNCSSPSVCSSAFTVGTTIVLTANPQGTSTFGGWNGCSSSSGSTCTVVLQNALTVTATFN
jgi:hypothetical protein